MGFGKLCLFAIIWYIDDIFMVWTHGEDKIEDFINHKINLTCDH